MKNIIQYFKVFYRDNSIRSHSVIKLYYRNKIYFVMLDDQFEMEIIFVYCIVVPVAIKQK